MGRSGLRSGLDPPPRLVRAPAWTTRWCARLAGRAGTAPYCGGDGDLVERGRRGHAGTTGRHPRARARRHARSRIRRAVARGPRRRRRQGRARRAAIRCATSARSSATRRTRRRALRSPTSTRTSAPSWSTCTEPLRLAAEPRRRGGRRRSARTRSGDDWVGDDELRARRPTQPRSDRRRHHHVGSVAPGPLDARPDRARGRWAAVDQRDRSGQPGQQPAALPRRVRLDPRRHATRRWRSSARCTRASATARGQHIDVSGQAATASILATALTTYLYTGTMPVRDGNRSVAPWGFYTCRDGRVLIQVTEDPQWFAPAPGARRTGLGRVRALRRDRQPGRAPRRARHLARRGAGRVGCRRPARRMSARRRRRRSCPDRRRPARVGPPPRPGVLPSGPPRIERRAGPGGARAHAAVAVHRRGAPRRRAAQPGDRRGHGGRPRRVAAATGECTGDVRVGEQRRRSARRPARRST